VKRPRGFKKETRGGVVKVRNRSGASGRQFHENKEKRKKRVKLFRRGGSCKKRAHVEKEPEKKVRGQGLACLKKSWNQKKLSGGLAVG